jgi:Glycosyl transferase family 2
VDSDPQLIMPQALQYVLITPARNEAEFIELTIQAVVAQSVPPLKWVIVSDGSTDGTDTIVDGYSAIHPWIELKRMPERRERSFGGKADAVNAAYDSVRNLDFQVVAILDADISVSSGNFEFLLEKLAEDSSLGIVGVPFQETSGKTYDYRFVSIEHVSGACQVFRRRCFEDVNGYTPLPVGGIDHLAVITARMKGWKTRTFTETVCQHHRTMGTAEHSGYAAWYRTGIKDYTIGGHPLWELARVVVQIFRAPLIVRGLALGAGYFGAMARRVKRPVPTDVQAFHRQEQMRRLREMLMRKTGMSASRSQRPA